MGQIAQVASNTQLAQKGKGEINYFAKDGTPVKLTPGMVVKYCVQGADQLPDKEVFRFMALCRARGLNPLAGDVHLAAFKGRATVMVSRDFYRLNAQKYDTYQGLEEGTIVLDAEGNICERKGEFYLPTDTLLGGWCRVFDSRYSQPTYQAVRLDEYDQKNSMWNSKRATMIVKVAEAHALRLAYTADFAGTYTADEITSGNVEPADVDVETGEVMEPSTNPQATLEQEADNLPIDE